MKIQIQENDILIVDLGNVTHDDRNVTREVTFEINGTQFTRKIILGPNGIGEDYSDPEKFYMMNKEQVDTNLIEYLSENHLYYNK